MKIEDLEIKTELHNLSNSIKIKDGNGNITIYRGKFYAIQIHSDWRITGHATLRKQKETTEIKKRYFKENEPKIRKNRIWDVGTMGIEEPCILINNGKINTNGEYNYRDDLTIEALNLVGIKPTEKLFDEVFSPIEQKLMEEYQRIRES